MTTQKRASSPDNNRDTKKALAEILKRMSAAILMLKLKQYAVAATLAAEASALITDALLDRIESEEDKA